MMRLALFVLLGLALPVAQASTVTVKQIQDADAAANKGDLATAVKLYRELAEASPTSGEFWGSLGRCEFGLKQYEACIADVERGNALGFYPQQGEYLVARAYAAERDKSKSLKALEKALKAGYYGADAPGGDKEFDLLKGNSKFAKLTGRGMPSVSRDEAWKVDIDFMVREARRMHVSFDKIAGKRAIDEHLQCLKETCRSFEIQKSS